MMSEDLAETRTNALATDCAEAIRARLTQLVDEVVALNMARDATLGERFGPGVRSSIARDSTFHLRHLAEAIALGSPDLFTNYLAWLKVLLAGYAVGGDDIMHSLQSVRDAVLKELDPAFHPLVHATMAPGLRSLGRFPREAPSFLVLDQPHSGLANLYLSALLKGRRREAEQHVLTMVRSGAAIDEIYLHVFQRTQREIGRLWQLNHISVAQEHFSTAVTQGLMARLYPVLLEARPHRPRRLRCLATCVSGDLHALGMNMVSDILEMHGWDCFYSGANTPTPAILHMLRREKHDVLLVSVTLTYHLQEVRELIAAVKSAPDLAHVRVVVGGFAFSTLPDLWRDLGADAMAPDAHGAAALLEQFERP